MRSERDGYSNLRRDEDQITPAGTSRQMVDGKLFGYLDILTTLYARLKRA